MSASVTVDGFGSEQPKNTGTHAVAEPVPVIDDLTVVEDLAEDLVEDDITVIEDDLEIIEDAAAPASPATPAADEPPSGIHDPIMPLVIVGVITLIALLALAATLSL